MDEEQTISPLLLPMAVVGGWLVPGLGYWILGQKSRGLVVFGAILLLFFMGVLIGGIKVVDAPTQFTTAQLFEKPWYALQVLAGMVAVVSAYAANQPWIPVSHAHSFDIGTLYTSVAGFLNLLTIVDVGWRAAGQGAA
jgi:hypothetical protein